MVYRNHNTFCKRLSTDSLLLYHGRLYRPDVRFRFHNRPCCPSLPRILMGHKDRRLYHGLAHDSADNRNRDNELCDSHQKSLFHPHGDLVSILRFHKLLLQLYLSADGFRFYLLSSDRLFSEYDTDMHESPLGDAA